MKPHSAKAKGRRLQQYVRDKVVEVLNLSPDDVFSRSMGAFGTDVYCSPVGQAKFPFAVECKNQETFSIYKAWDQAVENGLKTGLNPVIVYKKNGRDPLVILDFNLFLNMVKEIPEW
jgi:hypothetical protein